jgi:hypothetical protein
VKVEVKWRFAKVEKNKFSLRVLVIHRGIGVPSDKSGGAPGGRVLVRRKWLVDRVEVEVRLKVIMGNRAGNKPVYWSKLIMTYRFYADYKD